MTTHASTGLRAGRALLLALPLTLLLGACGNGDGNSEKDQTGMKTETAARGESQNTDPHRWLEEVEGEKALQWAEARNDESLPVLTGHPDFEDMRQRALDVYNAEDKIAYGSLLGGQVHNFWQDSEHVRGIWRMTDLADYKSDSPQWQTVLDLDALAEQEGENWVYKGRSCLPPDHTRCLVQLSRGGADAVVVREFDVAERAFVENGFKTPESKQWSTWQDEDTLLIATDFGDGTMNESGYPRQVRRWQRGTPLADAELVLEGSEKVVFNFPFSHRGPDHSYSGVIQGPDFFTEIIHLMGPDGLQQLDLPRAINFQGFLGDRIILQMRKDWPTDSGASPAPAGSLVALSVADARAGRAASGLEVILAPRDRQSIDSVSIGRDRLFIAMLDNVKGRLVTAAPGSDGWALTERDIGDNGSVDIVSTDGWSDNALINFQSFLTPDTLFLMANGAEPEAIRRLPARFDTDGLITEQKTATSKDGTEIPYFVIRPKDAPMDGSTPTMLYGYGGFEIALTPSYFGGFPMLWVERGGAYVVANIRGGGEFGPAWHQAALKENRQRAYDDFIAVGEHLAETGLTSPRHLGIFGGSNGGLLTGVMLTQRPDLWNGVIIGVPLLDMLRYDKLLAGASWVGEYGDPDIPKERAWIAQYSPYQNLKAEADYPEPFVFTSTRDDRVHPGHARKFVARMREMGHDVLYYENTEGGHAASANLKQRAFNAALMTSYALQKLHGNGNTGAAED
ncbi:prolyl oligopeptidase family serine peptidase [Yunchengibacter salinarum]|uniref:prolyl oligopeptidase family serine peptidase n=1 Tax=Yunchengibacter salinarum TaxID=3133399 RepID=UPI0035B61BDD